MTDLNLAAAWLGILLGIAGGVVFGVFFHEEGWLGGYGSWRRRLLRLGHVSLFGLGFLNLAFALTAERLDAGPRVAAASVLFVAGAILMPAVCGLTAWRPSLRTLFVLPVGCLATAAGLTAFGVLRTGGAS